MCVCAGESGGGEFVWTERAGGKIYMGGRESEMAVKVPSRLGQVGKREDSGLGMKSERGSHQQSSAAISTCD